MNLSAFGLSPDDAPPTPPRFVLNTFFIVVTALVSQSLMSPHLLVAVAEFCTHSMGGGHGERGRGERGERERKMWMVWRWKLGERVAVGVVCVCDA